MSNLEVAGRALLGTNGPVQPESFPKKLTLDPTIHDTLTEIILQTRDGRERSLDFHYEDQRWVAGKIYRGTPSRGNLRHALKTNRKLIPLMAHTHPLTYESPMLLPGFINRLLLGSDYREAREKQKMHARAGNATPSPRDIRMMYISSGGGGVGNIVASEEGIFLAVFRKFGWDANDTKESWKTVYDEMWAARDAEREAFADAWNLDDFDAMQAMVCSGIAKAIAARFTSYFSNDPENPRLARIQ